jgi:hypothetical protein
MPGETDENITLPEAEDLVVFEIVRDSECAECRKKLLAHDFLFMEDGHPLCLTCADLRTNSIVLNCALCNGDAHLKNFGIFYDDVQGEARLAPVYDLVTTSVYVPKDSMALTLNGTTKWASAKELQRLGETRMGGTPSRVRQILERVEAAVADTSKELQAYLKAHAEFREIGNRMLQQWRKVSRFRFKRPESNRLLFSD